MVVCIKKNVDDVLFGVELVEGVANLL